MSELVCRASDPGWLEARRAGVTATDIVTICGLSRHDSAYSLYWRKMSALPEIPDSDRFRLGRALEAYIVRRWHDEHPGWTVKLAGLYRSAERDWQRATPDRVVHEHGREATGVLECKSWADADSHAWDAGPPPAVRAQALWQADTLAVPLAHVAVLFLPSGAFTHFEIDMSEAVSDVTLLRGYGATFWRQVTGELPPPGVDGSAATRAALIARWPGVEKPKQAEVSDDLWGSYAAAKVTAKHFEDQAREYEARIREAIGDAGEITVNGEVVGHRLRYPVKAHHRKESTVDKITRVKAKEASDDD